MKLNKYFRVAQNTWYENIEYRFNFVMWRLRVVLQLLTVYFLWLALIPPGATVFNYSQDQMLTYILLGSIIGSIVFSSRSHSVGEEINNGDLSNFLIRPLNYFVYHFFRDIGDKGLNIIFSIVEISVLILLFNPPIFLQSNALVIILTIFTTIIAAVLFFFTNILLGMIAFWSPEVWAPRFIFNILLTFLSGSMFPLDIVPEKLFSLFQYLPFTYMLYFPVKIYLGQLTFEAIWIGIMISLIWTVLLYGLLKLVWNTGIKGYAANGR